MIKYNLTCECSYVFDSWFSSSEEFERLKKGKFLVCPDCDSKNIKKSIMSPNLSNKTKKKLKVDKFTKDINKKLLEFRTYIEKNCKYVGNNFVQEARSIHYDKKTSKGIYGKATPEETAELEEEGIEVATIPWIDKPDS